MGVENGLTIVRDTSNDKIHSVYKMGEKPSVRINDVRIFKSNKSSEVY